MGMLDGELVGIMDSIFPFLAESSLICGAENSCCFFTTNITLNLHLFTMDIIQSRLENHGQKKTQGRQKIKSKITIGEQKKSVWNETPRCLTAVRIPLKMQLI